MTNPHSNVSILTLEKQDSLAVLARNHFGRIAYSFRDRVNIEPISYVFENDWIFGRTSLGSKWLTLQHHPWVAFEVEEVVSEHEWKTVVVHGTVSFFDQDGATPQRQLFETALASIRKHSPWALTEHDRTPERDRVFGIYVHDISGRECAARD